MMIHRKFCYHKPLSSPQSIPQLRQQKFEDERNVGHNGSMNSTGIVKFILAEISS